MGVRSRGGRGRRLARGLRRPAALTHGTRPGRGPVVLRERVRGRPAGPEPGGVRPDSSETVYSGKLLSVTIERWGDYEREILEHPGAVAIVAVDQDECLALVRQLREAARRPLLELPAGTL